MFVTEGQICRLSLFLYPQHSGFPRCAVEAELDKPAEARASLLQRMTGMGEDEPDDNDWYVFGRIAECYGLQQEAAGMYHRVQPPRNTLTVADSSYALAQRRLKSMAAGH